MLVCSYVCVCVHVHMHMCLVYIIGILQEAGKEPLHIYYIKINVLA